MTSLQSRLAAIASLPGHWPPRLMEMAFPAVWITGALSISLLAFRLTGQGWLAFGLALAMVLAVWRLVKLATTLREALKKAERTCAAMEQALRQAQQMEALGRLAVGVAHDFNNHLTVISSNVEMLAQRLEPSQDRLLRHTEAAMQGVQRAAALTGRLLSFSNHTAHEPEAVDVSRLVGGLSDLLRRTLGDRIGLEVILPDTSWLIWADTSQMENALLSLTVNGRDQVRDGAKLTIEVANLRIDAFSRARYPQTQPGDYIQIALNDSGAEGGETGAWLPADDPGGIDLSMARAFVRDAGGNLLRSGSSAGGISVRLLLPRYSPLANSTAVSRRETGERPTILVVEDDPAVRSACVEILRDLSYRVLEAPDAMEAFRLIADQGGIDLLFTDLGLPGGVTGRALADAARNVDADIRVLFTTGYERVDLPDSTAAAVLRKPFNPEQLAAMVRDVLAAPSPDGRVAVAKSPTGYASGASPTTQPGFPRSATVSG